MPPGLSRSVKRRLDRRNAIAKRVNHAVDALNLLYSGKDDAMKSGVVDSICNLPLNQQSALRCILQNVQDLGSPPAGACGQGALKALRAAPSLYEDCAGGVGDVVPMSLPCLSLPNEVVAGVDLLGALEEPVKGLVSQFEDTMLQDADVWTSISSNTSDLTPYNDPFLRDRRQYLAFLQHLYSRGILDFADGCRGRVGAFTVSKKPKEINGVVQTRQRLVLDCRQTNLLFRPSPHTQLGSLAALSDLIIPQGHNMYMSGSDIRDCFYAVRLPRELAAFFGLHLDINAREASIVSGLGEGHFDGWNCITPVIAVLPMGFSWSFFLVQHIHESVSLRALNIPRTQLVLEQCPLPTLQPGNILAMPYCDNVHSIGLNEKLTNEGKEAICNSLSDIGFSMHEDAPASSTFATLGGVIDGEIGQVRATPARMWNLILAFMHIRQGSVHPEVVQRLLGHAMVVAVLNRAGMSIFHRLYKFAQSTSGPRPLNNKEKVECFVFAGIIPLLFADLRRDWSDEVHCTDASPDGFGVCSTFASVDEVQNVGRWNERWRYKRLPPQDWQPRRRAMALDVFSDVSTVSGTGFHEMSYDNYIENPLFEEVPNGLLHPSRWSTKMMGKWEHTEEHITLKEGRALVLCARRLSRSYKYRNKRHVILVDNLGLALATCKGRAANFKMLRIMQQLAAISLACNFSLKVRWIPSEKNVSDGPSRGQILPGAFKPWGEQEELEASARQNAEDCEESDCTAHAKETGENRECEEEDCSASFQSLAEEGTTSHETGGSVAMQRRTEHWEESEKQSTDSLGATECVEGDPASISRVLQQVQEFLPSRRFGVASWRRVRPGDGRLPRHPLSRGPFGKRGREVVGGSRISPCRVEGQDVSFQKSAEGLAKGKTTEESVATASLHRLWDCHGPDSSRQESHGFESAHGLRCIPTSWRKFRAQGERHPQTSQGSRPTVQVLLHHHSRPRGPGRRQDRHLRQHSVVQHTGSGVCWRDDVESQSNQKSCDGQPVQLHSRGLQEGVPAERQSSGSAEASPIPTQAWGGVGRYECQDPGSCSDQAERQMAHGPERPTICKDRQASTDAQPTVTRSAGVLSMVEKQHGKGGTRQSTCQNAVTSLGWDDVLRKKPLPPRFALEIFAGTARITKALHTVGFYAFPIDICIAEHHNLLDTYVERDILHLLQSGRVSFLWLGMPCTSFSRARKWDGLGPGPLRDLFHLNGFSWLNDADKKKVRTGNDLLRVSLRFLQVCEQLSIPYALENPSSSYA